MIAALATALLAAGQPVDCNRAMFSERHMAESERILRETRKLLEQTREIRGERAVVAERLAQLSQMNPLARGLKAAFDSDYDETSLRANDTELSERLKLLSESAALLKLQSDLLALDREQFSIMCGSRNSDASDQ